MAQLKLRMVWLRTTKYIL